jgi:hypothetical protein
VSPYGVRRFIAAFSAPVAAEVAAMKGRKKKEIVCPRIFTNFHELFIKEKNLSVFPP